MANLLRKSFYALYAALLQLKFNLQLEKRSVRKYRRKIMRNFKYLREISQTN